VLPSVHPLSSAWSQNQQVQQGNPSIPLQLLLGYPEAFPGPMGHIIPSVIPLDLLGPPPSWRSPKNLQKEATRKHPNQMNYLSNQPVWVSLTLSPPETLPPQWRICWLANCCFYHSMTTPVQVRGSPPRLSTTCKGLCLYFLSCWTLVWGQLTEFLRSRSFCSCQCCSPLGFRCHLGQPSPKGLVLQLVPSMTSQQAPTTFWP